MSDVPIRCTNCGITRWMSLEWCQTVVGCVVKCPDCGANVAPQASTEAKRKIDERFAKEYRP